jgi:cyanophycin synthetase
VFDIANSFFLLRTVYHLRRLLAFLPRRDSSRHRIDLVREDFYEQLWRHAAEEVGARCTPLGGGICEIRRRGRITRVLQNTTAIDDPVTLAIALDKTLVSRMLADAGLPIPKHVAFQLRTLPKAIEFLEKLGRPCVVKPANGTGGGVGITTGILTPQQLAWSATLAAQYGSDILLEEQIAGENYRLLYLDGVLLDAVQRRPPSVTGDGRSTIRHLVEQANAARLNRGAHRVVQPKPDSETTLPDAFSHMLITIDMDMKQTLARQGLSLSSVPPSGACVQIKTVINQNFAGDNITVTDRLNPSIIADGARAASAVGVRLAGIDIISPDPGVPLQESGGVILEVNTTPGFHYHYHKNDGTYPVAVKVLETLFAELPQSDVSYLISSN